jgi:protein arginine kinase activator
MLCSVCKKKPATVHLTQIVNDKMQKVDLCEDCAKDKGVNDPTGFMMADMIFGVSAPQEIAEPAAPAAKAAELACPKCGCAQSDFKKLGRFGCAHCYQVFSEGLEDLLKSMHKGTRHVGKVPGSQREAPPANDAADRLQQLSRQLEQAVAQEDYEMAAKLRDEIKALKHQSPGQAP